ncbi:MAG: DUF5723 family protein [Flavobacteriales bacterium]
MVPIKRIPILALLAVVPLSLFGQSEITSFTVTGRGGVATTFVTDYHSIGINPANLGWERRFEDKKFTLGFFEGSYSIYAEALRKDEIRKEFSKFGERQFSWDEKADAARDFAENGLAINADMMSIGAAYTSKKLGGIAFNVRDRFRSYIELSPTASEILFEGYNASYFDIKLDAQGDTLGSDPDPDSVAYGAVSDSAEEFLSEITQGSQMDMTWYREFNLSYGRKILKNDALSLYVGGGVKYIRGFALMKVRSNDDGDLTAFSATSPAFDIDYGKKAIKSNPSSDTTNSGFLPDAVGKGFGFDLGVNAVIGKKLKLGASMNNVGSISWEGNVYEALDTIVYDTESPGANSYNFVEALDSISGDSGVFRWAGKKKKKVKLPSVARFGASYKLSEMIEVGADFVMPLNDAPGSYRQAIYGVGAKVDILEWLEVSAGVKSNAYGDVLNVPVGLVLKSKTGVYEAGIASRDAVTFFSKNEPTLSLSTGFLRFRF